MAGSPQLWGRLVLFDASVWPPAQKRSAAAWLARHAAGVQRLQLTFAALGGPASLLASLAGGPLEQLQVVPTSVQETEGEFDAAFAPLAGLRALTRLDLSHLGLDALPTHISSLAWLRELCLRGNELASLDPDPALAPLAALGELAELDLSRCRLKRVPLCLLGLGALEVLRLDGNPTLGTLHPEEAAQRLTRLASRLPRLKTVRVWGCNVPRASLEALAEALAEQGGSLDT